MAKNPQTRLPSVNSVGNTATARIGFMAAGFRILESLSRKRLLPAGDDVAAGADRVAGLHRDFHGTGRQDQLGPRA